MPWLALLYAFAGTRPLCLLLPYAQRYDGKARATSAIVGHCQLIAGVQPLYSDSARLPL
ncbi:hypothetical protein K431DRAFT_285967 [Polychaeton citri CBS 116435]|uniref:Uncharacterized protein n=1 Tax=Polychaeton citri CBS 116435 TaxID=1314669 RepID=A0A9P4Q8H6_9PEZI|nr:hypothetical protein K431DRAFT_285967 [Polychaeton citri CBS 116435]